MRRIDLAKKYFDLDGCTLERQGSGINSFVYLARGSDGRQKGILKLYGGVDHVDRRERMERELGFLRLAGRVCRDRVPSIIGSDTNSMSIMLEYISGSTYCSGTSPVSKDINEALRFMRDVNQDMSLCSSNIKYSARDSSRSLTGHLSELQERLLRLGSEHLPKDLQLLSNSLIAALWKRYERISKAVLDMIQSGRVLDYVDRDCMWVSPSDFGFHNAIKTESGPVFIDFEYSGWDDPCKTSSDFYLQPSSTFSVESTFLMSALPTIKSERLLERFSVVSRIQLVKWNCIILGLLDERRLEAMLRHSPRLDIGQELQERVLLLASPRYQE